MMFSMTTVGLQGIHPSSMLETISQFYHSTPNNRVHRTLVNQTNLKVYRKVWGLDLQIMYIF
jgi:hypothetical protein